MSSAGRAGVILDRDGTLIDFVRDPELGIVTPAFHPRHIRFLPGVLDGLRSLSRAGFVLAIATNQPQAAKGELTLDAIEATQRALLDRLRAESIDIASARVCLHHPTGGEGGDPSLIRDCNCRKPKPGMLVSLVDELGLDRATSWMVGDTRTDVEAARSAGLHAGLLMAPGRCELCPLRSDAALAEEMGVPAPLARRHLDELASSIIEARS